jgi:hypothetical protein
VPLIAGLIGDEFVHNEHGTSRSDLGCVGESTGNAREKLVAQLPEPGQATARPRQERGSKLLDPARKVRAFAVRRSVYRRCERIGYTLVERLVRFRLHSDGYGPACVHALGSYIGVARLTGQFVEPY